MIITSTDGNEDESDVEDASTYLSVSGLLYSFPFLFLFSLPCSKSRKHFSFFCYGPLDFFYHATLWLGS